MVLPPCLPYPHPPLGRTVRSEDGVKGHLARAALCPTSAEGEFSCSSLSQLTNCRKVLEKRSEGEGRRKGTAICWVHSLSFIHSFIQQHSLSTGWCADTCLAHLRSSGPRKWGWCSRAAVQGPPVRPTSPPSICSAAKDLV